MSRHGGQHGQRLDWVAIYNGDGQNNSVSSDGDSNNNELSSDAAAEPVSITGKGKADLSITLSGPVKAGLTMKSAAGSKKVGAEKLWMLSSLAVHGSHTYKITYGVSANTHRSVTRTTGTGARTTDPNSNNKVSRQVRLG